MQTISKMHEKNVQTSVHTEEVNNILNNVENVPYALRGSTTKTVLYWLFCLIAASELTAALFFYVASLGANIYVAVVISASIGFVFHWLLHSILTDTTKGMVFSKMRESKAMSNEVRANIVLSIVLLIIAACTVFFVGKKGFAAFRATKYETAQTESKPKDGIKSIEITAEMLTNKKGKISSNKLEQLAAVTTATAKATETKTTAEKQDRDSYDLTTVNVTDIVGASAFVLELLLALLAYSIATAKFAATFDEIARRNAKETLSVLSDPQPETTTTETVTQNVTQPKQIGFSQNTTDTGSIGNDGRTVIKGFQRNELQPKEAITQTVTQTVSNEKLRVCEYCDEPYIYGHARQKYCCEECRISAWQEKNSTVLRKVKKP